MQRRYFSRFATRFSALAVTALALACCAPPMVSAPPYYGYGRLPPPPPAPPGPPSPTGLSAPAGPAKVALLVPLSGANAELGQAILDAAQLAVFEAGGDPLVLIPRDTGGNAAGAASVARAVIADGARLILGPLLAPEVEAVKPIARDAHINVIAFSTVTSLAGENVYLMGFLPRQEVVREVSYARQRGLDRFAALAPNSPYGHLMADTLREVAPQSGGTVTKLEFYDPRSNDFSSAAQRLMPAGAPDGSPAPTSTPPPARPFDALLLPEGGAKLKQIARLVKASGADPKPIQLLGSGLWDTPDIGSDPALVGGWFASSSPEARQDFDRRFSATYKHNPPRLASLGYDAAALAAALAHSQTAEPFSQQAILNPSGFTGVDGLFRFTPNGLVQRGLAVLEVEPQGPVVVSPAPQNFQDFAY